MKRNIKFMMLLGGIMVVSLMTLGITFIKLQTNQEKFLTLSNLIETPYEVLKIKDLSNSDVYEVYLSGEFDFTDQVLLATKMQKAIQNHEQINHLTLNLHMYAASVTKKQLNNTVDLTDKDYEYTIQVENSNVIHYEPIHFKGVKGDVTASNDWFISNSYFNEEEELIFEVSVQPDLEPETLFSTLKGISDEMIRYNFENKKKAVTKQVTSLNENTSVYFLSDFDNLLIQKTILVGKGE